MTDEKKRPVREIFDSLFGNLGLDYDEIFPEKHVPITKEEIDRMYEESKDD